MLLTERLQKAPAAALQAPIPKQYLEILGQPIALYSLRTFATMPEVGEIIVVCEPEYRRACCLRSTATLILSGHWRLAPCAISIPS